MEGIGSVGRPNVAQTIQTLGRPVFTTREIALVRHGSISATSHDLARLAKQGRLQRITRGLWADPNDRRFTRYHLVPFLVGRHHAYVSFLSALNLHRIIEQIPQIVYAATTGHTRLKKTSIATYSFHRIDPRFFAGFEWYGAAQDFLIATPEKALVDSLYLSTRKGKPFGFFPELDFSNLSVHRARKWIRQIPDPRIRTSTFSRLDRLREREQRRRN